MKLTKSKIQKLQKLLSEHLHQQQWVSIRKFGFVCWLTSHPLTKEKSKIIELLLQDKNK